MLRLLLVDDHAPFRRTARVLFHRNGFDVVGESVDGRSAIAAVARLRPDVLLLDVQLPDMSGFAVAQQVMERSRDGSPAIVLTSTRDRNDYGDRVDKAPIMGFLTKSQLSPDALLRVAQKAYR